MNSLTDLDQRRACAQPDTPTRAYPVTLASVLFRFQQAVRAQRNGEDHACRYELRILAREARRLADSKDIR